MILTTSRKPSRKTRRLARVLAAFMNWEYITRGKLSLEDLYSMLKKNENLAIIEEIKGNPAILKIVNSQGRLILQMKFTVGEIKRIKMDNSPVAFYGKPPFDPLLLEALPSSKPAAKLVSKLDFKKEVYVRKKDDLVVLEFKYNNELITRLKVYESRVYI